MIWLSLEGTGQNELAVSAVLKQTLTSVFNVEIKFENHPHRDPGVLSRHHKLFF